MKTTRIILKVPFYKHPAGTVFDLAENTEPTDWPEDDRLREKQSFIDKRVYLLPDGGRGFAVSLPLDNTVLCPEHVFEDQDIRKGECRVTLAGTRHGDEEVTKEDTPVCGILREENVSIQHNAALKSQGLLINLPPFAVVAEKMVLLDSLRNEMVLEYVLRNYKLTDTQLTWDVTDLHPGFYELRICFPDDWYHTIRFIKFFPAYIEVNNIPAAPEKRWQPLVNSILDKIEKPVAEETHDLRNQALAFCLEWGVMFSQPTQPRMMAQFELSQSEADALDRLAREVQSFVYDLCEQELAGTLLESDIHFETKRKYTWVNAANFSRLKNVGMYYARK